MNGAHDMGGTHGFGPVEPEPDEPVFHADWERRAFALTVAMGATGEWNLDESRFAREDRPPADYLGRTYYEIWLGGLERLLAERGLRYFCTDQSATDEPLAALAPVAAAGETVAYAIDWEAVGWLWSLDGYPSDPLHADFHRKSLRGARPWAIGGDPYETRVEGAGVPILAHEQRHVLRRQLAPRGEQVDVTGRVVGEQGATARVGRHANHLVRCLDVEPGAGCAYGA